jgi:hypothetical protein
MKADRRYGAAPEKPSLPGLTGQSSVCFKHMIAWMPRPSRGMAGVDGREI